MTRCRMCRRLLRTVESQSAGIGPKCARMERQKDLFDEKRNEKIDAAACARARKSAQC